MFIVARKHFDFQYTGYTKFLVSKDNYDILVDVNFHDTLGQPLSFDSKKYTLGKKYAQFPTYQTPTGYRFKRWADAPTGGKALTVDSLADMFTKDIYAQYVQLVPIEFDSDGGTVDGGSEKLTLSCAPGFPFSDYGFPTASKDEYKFDGWYTEKNRQGTMVYSSTICPDAATTYYAGYFAKVDITYDTDGGYFEDTSQATKTVQYFPGDQFYSTYFPYSGFYKEGYNFVGWYTEKNGQGEQIYEYTSCPMQSTTYYAFWVSMVTITFDADGGTCDNGEPTQSYQCMPGSYMYEYLYAPYAYKSNAQFAGWYSEKGGQGYYFDNYSTCPYYDTTYYAYWIEMVNVIFYFEGGNYDGDPGPQTRQFYPNDCYYYYSSFPQLTYTGKTFNGWYTEQGGQGYQVNEWDYCSPSVTALYAYWTDTPNINTVKYAGPYGNYQYDGPVIGTVTYFDGNECVVQFNGASEIEGYSGTVTFYLNYMYCSDGNLGSSGYEAYSYNWYYPSGYSFDIYIKFVEIQA